MEKAQQWLDQNYPLAGTCIREDESDYFDNYGKTRSEITQLAIHNQDLTGELNLTTFTNLEKLDCENNQLTQLILPLNNQIRAIFASNNFLTSFDYDRLNPTTLTSLDLSNNNLELTDLSVFSPLVNLEALYLGNNIQIKGSLIALKNLTKLEILDISDTNINQGVEYLPVSIRDLYYLTYHQTNCQIKEIEKELTEFQKDTKSPLKQKIKAQEKLLLIFDIINQKDISSDTIKKILNIIVFNLEQEIIDFRKKLCGKENYQAQIEQR